MKHSRLLGIIGLVIGVLLAMVGLFLAFITIIVALVLAGGHTDLRVWTPTILTLGSGILLIVLSVIAIVKGKNK